MASSMWDDILATAGRRYEDVEVSEWGRSVRVWSLSALDVVDFISRRDEIAGSGSSSRPIYEWVLMRCLGAAGGAAPTAADGATLGQFLRALGPQSTTVMSRLTSVALRLSGSTPEAVEEIRGN